MYTGIMYMRLRRARAHSHPKYFQPSLVVFVALGAGRGGPDGA